MTALPTAHAGPLELSPDARFRRRVVRLSIVSAVALGIIWWLATATPGIPAAVGLPFLAGWLLMPLTLVASLARPRLRYGLVVPTSLVSIGLLAVVVGWPPAEGVALAGWVLMLLGVALGGGLGLWFWYRLLPVPAGLDDPFSPARWALVGLHIALTVAGMVLVATALA